MNTSQLRHDLRTPLNHIVGYCQLLLEEAEAEAQGPGAAWVQPVQRVSELARQLSKILETLVSSTSPPDLDKLRGALKQPVQEISEALRSIHLSEDSAQSADVRRLLQATGKLSHFIGTGSLAQTTASSEPDTYQEVLTTLDHLLVVDDDHANRDLLGRMLTRLNYRVSTAADGAEGLDLLNKNDFDLVLLDILMPGMSGYEVLERMKASLPGIPVIVISALEDMESVVRCLEMGAEDYFLKPFDLVLLRARIAAALDRKKFRDRLVVQERMASLGELTAGIAHEIKNPLNFIINFAGLAVDTIQELEGAMAPEMGTSHLVSDLKQFLSKIREHGLRADQIVKSMLLHARNESPAEERAGINEVVKQYLKLVHFSFSQEEDSAEVDLQTEYDPNAGSTVCRPADLGRVIINLVTNAYHAVTERKNSEAGFKPRIVVRTRDLGQAIELAVRDNGHGVPEEIRQKIFNPFFTTRPAGTGVGLGLSISYDIIVRGHHGQLTFNSRNGQYTEFVAQIPRR